MFTSKVAELFAELSVRGDINKTLDAVRDRLVQTDKLVQTGGKSLDKFFILKMQEGLQKVQLAQRGMQAFTSETGQAYLKQNAQVAAQVGLLEKVTALQQVRASAAFQASAEGQQLEKQ